MSKEQVEYLSQKQIADKLGVSKQKIYRCIKTNHIKEAHSEVVKGNTVLMYDTQAVEQIKGIIKNSSTVSDEVHQEVHQEAVNEAVLKQYIEALNEQLKAKDTHIANLNTQNENLLKQLEEKDKLHHESQLNMQKLLDQEQQLRMVEHKRVLELEERVQTIEEPAKKKWWQFGK